MKILSLLFWCLIFATAGVSYRWGSIVGLIFFIFMLMIDATLATRWNPR